MRERVVVFRSGRSWDGVPGTDRMIAEELRRHCHVLWVDPPVSVATPAGLRYGASRVPVPRLRNPVAGVSRLSTYALPFQSHWPIRATSAGLVRSQIRWALRRLDARPHAVVDLGLSGLLDGWGPGVLKAFYGTDDYVAGASLMGLDKRVVEDAERKQVAQADLVIAISPVLADRWRGMGARKVVTVPNGVRPEAYDAPTVADELGIDLPRPVAGVVGHLSDRIDLDVLERVADSGCSVLMVGPRDPRWEPHRVDAFVARDRVVWTGRQPYESLPAYLRLMDVGITPYRDTAFNRASFPLKMLDYLAAGLPSVTTDLPAARWLETDLVRRVSDPADFPAAVLAEAAVSRTPELVAARKAFALQHSWRARTAAIATHLDLVDAGRVDDAAVPSRA